MDRRRVWVRLGQDDAVPILSLDDVFELGRRALEGSGASVPNAAPVAHSMREAEAQGIRNVGLAYLPFYCRHLRSGKVDGRAVPTWRRTADAALVVDAHHGFAHAAFDRALDDLVALAGSAGVAAMAVTRSYSAGVVGWFTDALAGRGLVSLAFANSPALVAPWGGTKPVFGTNPLGFGAPRAGHPPICVDMSTSATAYVNVVEAAATGRPIPADWALDEHGRPTTDAHAALRGTMAPSGGAKGYALGLMVDILAAGLTGSAFSSQAATFGDGDDLPPGVGQLFLAFDPARLGGEAFAQRLEVLVRAVTAEPGVRLPGDRRHEHRARVECDGVAVPAELLAEVESYC